MKLALDTNVLGYAAGVGDDEPKRRRAVQILKAAAWQDVIIPTQVAGEFYNVLTRKGGHPPKVARRIVEDWSAGVGLTAHSAGTMTTALEGAAFFNLQIWDALILTIAAEAGCSLLLSEDMQDGFVYRGVTVANPFAQTLHPLLASLLETPS
ncbi:PIN domain-containing protein [Brevundimonas intermedia]|uniref:PIN domain-containing protein n=1 Tax=Brevundimonas intermedia TaxID=74315 RepID=A0A4Y9RY87_9CAUL|nr:PIN domain-containing protein [Brevundimonas intermedia]TFW14024.1 PIN domain-containing protein [Brevundimonas intermedia]